MLHLREFEQEAERLAFLLASETFGLTMQAMAKILIAPPQRSPTESELLRVFGGAEPIPAEWWPRIRAYESRVRRRQLTLAAEGEGSGFGSNKSGMYTIDLDSALDRAAVARAILDMPDRKRAFIGPPPGWWRP